VKVDRFIALEIDEEYIRMGIFSRAASGQLSLLDRGFLPIESDSAVPMAREARVATALKQLLDEKKPSAQQAVISISGKSIFFRAVKLPPVAPDKLELTIAHEAVQNIPFPIDEVIWDSHTVNTSESEPDVILVAAKADLVEGLVHAVSATGLSVMRVDAAPVALANAVRHICSDTAVPLLLVDVGAGSSNVVFLDGARTFFRTLSVNAAQEDGLFKEIERSIAFYRSQPEVGDPEQILLTGSTVDADKLQSCIRLPVSVLDLQPLVRTIDADSNGLAVLAGSAMGTPSESSISVDLMPESVKREKSRLRRQPWWLACAGVIMLILAVWIIGSSRMTGLVSAENSAVSEHIRVLEKIESQLKPLELAISELEMRADAYQGAIEQRTFWLEALSEIRSRLPEGMFLLSSESLHESGALRGLRIEVLSYLDKEPEGADVVKRLRDSLRERDRFSTKTKVFSRPSKRQFVRQFILDVYFEEDLLK